jgi:glycosyltransferase involved in cell wall biosynthesis
MREGGSGRASVTQKIFNEYNMNIGILCGEYPPCKNGGIGTYTKDIAEGLTKMGHNVIVFGIYKEIYLKIDKTIEEEINYVKVIRIPFKKNTNNPYIDDLLNRLYLWHFTNKLIVNKSLNIIESYDSTGMLPFGTKVPVVTRLHGTVTFFGRELNRPYSRFISFFERQQLKKSKLIIGVSKYVLDQSIKYFNLRKNGIVIYNSVIIPDIKSAFKTPDEKYILYFGSILPKKGVEQLILSMKNVFEKNPDFSLIMIGKSFVMKDGTAYPDYLSSLLPKEYHKKLKVISHLDKVELYSYIAGSYCCVFPSFSECFSLAPMEAMSLGKPVVYSTLHSGPELITDGVNGLLVNPANVQEIADKIIWLINNPDKAKSFGEQGKKTIETRFNYDAWLRENEKMYFDLISK